MALTADEKRKMAAQKRRERLLARGTDRLSEIAGEHHAPGLDIKTSKQASDAEKSRIAHMELSSAPPGQPRLDTRQQQGKATQQQQKATSTLQLPPKYIFAAIMTAVIGSSLMETSPSYALGALYVGLTTTHVMGMATFVPPGSMLTMATMMMGPTVSKLANVGYFIYCSLGLATQAVFCAIMITACRCVYTGASFIIAIDDDAGANVNMAAKLAKVAQTIHNNEEALDDTFDSDF